MLWSKYLLHTGCSRIILIESREEGPCEHHIEQWFLRNHFAHRHFMEPGGPSNDDGVCFQIHDLYSYLLVHVITTYVHPAYESSQP